MCGIAGMAGIGDKRLLRRMCDAIAHRGPNHYGSHVEKNAAIGYRRLSIIDVSGGNQPIYSEDGDIAVVFNGEIYNYLELKGELEKLGHRFKTNSDTETIVHGYEEWGPAVTDMLRGMFAIAIWDSGRKRLFLARDKFGKKPLYYTTAGGVFAFASEIKSLALLPGFKAGLDPKAIDAYLAFRFIPSPRTIYGHVKKLPPGSYLIWEDGKTELVKYWDLLYEPNPQSEGYFAKKVRQALDEAVKIRLMSEVPLGAYLSGGLDSSSVVALMARHSKKAVKTFSVGFGEEKYDELPFAREIAEEFATDHHELVVGPKSIKALPEIVWHLDEPMADPTAIPTYLLSKFAKRKVTVVLTGEGGDEVFAGYEQYKIMQLAYVHGKKIPRLLRKHVLPRLAKGAPKSLLDRIFKYSSALGRKGIERFSGFVSDLDSPAKSYLDLVQIFTASERGKLYAEKSLMPIDYSGLAGKSIGRFEDAGSLTAQMQLFDIKTELPDDLLMKVDKMTMAASIEARAPLLDVPLAELAFTIPSGLKIRGGSEKHIFRRAVYDLLPRKIALRKKARFFVPIDYWFGGDLKSISEGLLLEGRRTDVLFKKEEVKRILGAYPASPAYAARQLWSLICLQLWQRQSGYARPQRLEKLLSG